MCEEEGIGDVKKDGELRNTGNEGEKGVKTRRLEEGRMEERKKERKRDMKCGRRQNSVMFFYLEWVYIVGKQFVSKLRCFRV